MTRKSELKLKVKKLKKRVKHRDKIIKVGLKSIKEKEGKIAQLASVLDVQNKPSVHEVKAKHKDKHPS